jgi:hypothetical protein
MEYGLDKRLLKRVLGLLLLAVVPLAHAGFGPAATARDWCK